MKRNGLLLFALAAAVACRSSSREVAPEVELPDRWSTEAARTAAEPPAEWWRSFADPVLESLVERAVGKNLDVAIAVARVNEARALRDIASGARYPVVDGVAGASRTQFSENTLQGAEGDRTQSYYSAGFDASWEVDLFGSNRAALAASEAGLEAAEEGRRDALVTLLGEVARNYVELRGSQAQSILTRENADSERRTLELTRSRFEAGLATDLDVARAETLVSNTEALVPALEANAARSIHRLSVLLGEPPANLYAELSEPKPVPVAQGAVAELASGIPSDLLRRRPDIRRAERELAQAAALTDQATADLYPKLTLGGSLGLASSKLSDLPESGSVTWSVGGSLLAPIFDGGRLRAAVRVQDARQEQAVDRYRLTVLDALAEVEGALVSIERGRERRESLTKAVASSQRALDLANDLHLRGLIDFFEVLDAQRVNLLVESELARSDTTLSADTVALYKALGGGWETWEAHPPEAAAAQ